jgi:hypothetical protein
MEKYFYSDGSRKFGPYSIEELKNEEINANTLIWYEGLESWTLAKNIKKIEDVIKLIPPPIICNKTKTDSIGAFNNTVKVAPKKSNDKSLSKNLPFLLLLSSVTGIILGFGNLDFSGSPSGFMGGFIGLVISGTVLYTGLPLLIVRIVKWFSKNKRWDKKSTQLVWIIQGILMYLVLYGNFIETK